MSRLLRIASVVCLVFPVAWAIALFVFSEANSCDPGDDPTQARCAIFGHELGTLFYDVFWTSMFTMPLLGIVAAVLLLALSFLPWRIRHV